MTAVQLHRCDYTIPLVIEPTPHNLSNDSLTLSYLNQCIRTYDSDMYLTSSLS